jgi:glutaredoxin 3
MASIEVYCVRHCPYCAAAKALLKRKGVAFTEIDIAGNWEKRDEMIERASGQTTVPQIFVAGVHIGTASDLHKFELSGKLDALIGHARLDVSHVLADRSCDLSQARRIK